MTAPTDKELVDRIRLAAMPIETAIAEAMNAGLEIDVSLQTAPMRCLGQNTQYVCQARVTAKRVIEV
jgi:hypothetical protein